MASIVVNYLDEDFYACLELIHDYFLYGDIDKINDIVNEYLNKIKREKYYSLFKILIEISYYLDREDILTYYFEMINYEHFDFDVSFLNHIYHYLIKLNNFDLAQKLFMEINSLDKKYLKGINIDILINNYNSSLYRTFCVTYDRVEQDKLIEEEIQNVFDYFNQYSRDIKVLEYLDEVSYYRAKKFLNHNKRIIYTECIIDNRYIIYVKKKKINDNVDIESLDIKIGKYIIARNYERALKVALYKLDLESEFNIETIERIADIYHLLDNEELEEKYRNIANNIRKSNCFYESFIDEVRRLVYNTN